MAWRHFLFFAIASSTSCSFFLHSPPFPHLISSFVFLHSLSLIPSFFSVCCLSCLIFCPSLSPPERSIGVRFWHNEIACFWANVLVSNTVAPMTTSGASSDNIHGDHRGVFFSLLEEGYVHQRRASTCVPCRALQNISL